jgi:hypothetical protein
MSVTLLSKVTMARAGAHSARPKVTALAAIRMRFDRSMVLTCQRAPRTPSAY